MSVDTTTETVTQTQTTTKTVKHMTEADMSPIQLQRHYRALLRAELGDVRRDRKVALKQELDQIKRNFFFNVTSDTNQALTELQHQLNQRKLDEVALLDAALEAQKADHSERFAKAMTLKLNSYDSVVKS